MSKRDQQRQEQAREAAGTAQRAASPHESSPSRDVPAPDLPRRPGIDWMREGQSSSTRGEPAARGNAEPATVQQRRVGEQGKTDAEGPQQDTDCYDALSARAAPDCPPAPDAPTSERVQGPDPIHTATTDDEGVESDGHDDANATEPGRGAGGQARGGRRA